MDRICGALALLFGIIAGAELFFVVGKVAAAHVRQGHTGAVLGVIWFGFIALLFAGVLVYRVVHRYRAGLARR